MEMEIPNRQLDRKLDKILDNQKVLADALEFLVWKEWQLNMSKESHEMLTNLRLINGRKTNKWRA